MKISLKLNYLILSAILVFCCPAFTNAQQSVERFQQGLMKEEGEGSLLEAIEIYSEVAADESAGRSLQARALLQAGICYEKLGMQEAQKAYRKIISNYSEQTETVKIASSKLSLLTQHYSGGIDKSVGVNIRKVWEGPEDLMGETSPDGNYISYTDWETGDLAIYEIATGKTQRLTDKGTWEESPWEYAEDSRWSPDGKHIVYSWWNEEGENDLRVTGLDGSEPKVIFRNNKYNYLLPCDWSPDGNKILAYLSHVGNTVVDMALIDVDDGSVQVLKTTDTDRWPGILGFSPNGKHIAFDHVQDEESGQHDISVMNRDGSNQQCLISHPAHDAVLAWTPDGKYLLFSSDRDGTQGLYLVRVKDGKTMDAPSLVRSGMGSLENLGFTPEGSFYYSKSEIWYDIYMAELDPESGSLLSPITKIPTRFEGNNKEPDYSPDGKHLAYITWQHPSSSNNDQSLGGDLLMIRNLDTGEEHEIIPGYERVGYPRWSPDGQSLIMVVMEGQNFGLCLVDIASQQISDIFLPRKLRGGFGRHEWLPDGNSIIAGLFDDQRNSLVTLFDLQKEDYEVIYQSEDRIRQVFLSPDGRSLGLYKETESGKSLQVKPLKGGEPTELFRIDAGDLARIAPACTVAWTVDGDYILFMISNPDAEELYWELCRVPSEGGEAERLGVKVLRTPANLSVHPDGRHISFSAGSKPVPPGVWALENFLPSE
jgi:Tol biopolymer transport system component